MIRDAKPAGQCWPIGHLPTKNCNLMAKSF